MKERGIVRTAKNSLQDRQQVVSRTEITSVVQMTFKDLDSRILTLFINELSTKSKTLINLADKHELSIQLSVVFMKEYLDHMKN